jgi:CRP-like cAMP-binding protein
MTHAELAPYRDLLASSVVFRGLDAADLDAVLARCHLVPVQAGDVVLTEGQWADGLYIICEGRIEFFLPEHGPHGHRASRVRLNVLGPGRCFGEYGLIDDKPSSASATALMPARLCLLPRQDFRRLTERSERIGRLVYQNLLGFLVARLRSKDQELDVFLLDESREASSSRKRV